MCVCVYISIFNHFLIRHFFVKDTTALTIPVTCMCLCIYTHMYNTCIYIGVCIYICEASLLGNYGLHKTTMVGANRSVQMFVGAWRMEHLLLLGQVEKASRKR